MNILIYTKAAGGVPRGNLQDSERWKHQLEELGHEVRVESHGIHRKDTDVLWACHATAAAHAVLAARLSRPKMRILLFLAGTDIYVDFASNHQLRTDRILPAMEAADILVVKQEKMLEELPEPLREKAFVLFPAVLPLVEPETVHRERTERKQVIMVSNLRPIKDPLLIVQALGEIPEVRNIHISHIGYSLDSGCEASVHNAMKSENRYRWLGGMNHEATQRALLQSHLLVLTSKAESAPNVICEAVFFGIPVICSRIPGIESLLGPNYPGYFDSGDFRALALLLKKFENHEDFARELRAAAESLKQKLLLAREREDLDALLEKLTST